MDSEADISGRGVDLSKPFDSGAFAIPVCTVPQSKGKEDLQSKRGG